MALDLGVRTGVAYGRVDEIPTATALLLKKPTDHRSVAAAKLMDFLVAKFEEAPPALVAKEQMLSLGAFQSLGNAEATVRLHAGLHSIVESLCIRYGIKWTEAADSTIRKHFIGRARLGERRATKAAVLQRCHLLKMLPRDCLDDNLADACATHDWACANFGRASVSSQSLFLFGEAAE